MGSLKNAFFFFHDYGARNDPKLTKVLMKLGQEGKGVFWDLVEMLYEQGGKLLLSEIDSYAFALHTKTDCITSLINDFDLFKNDGNFFWSDSVNLRLQASTERSEKAAQSANSRWKNSGSNANASNKDASAMHSQSDSNAKEDKIGEDKIGNNKNNTLPTTLAGDVVSFLNVSANKSYQPNTPKTIQLITARFNEGFKLEDFKKVIEVKTSSWLNDPKYNRFLRPQTLFGPNFESYLNEPALIKPKERVVIW